MQHHHHDIYNSANVLYDDTAGNHHHYSALLVNGAGYLRTNYDGPCTDNDCPRRQHDDDRVGNVADKSAAVVD